MFYHSILTLKNTKANPEGEFDETTHKQTHLLYICDLFCTYMYNNITSASLNE